MLPHAPTQNDIEGTLYSVRSQSSREEAYLVDLNAAVCTCRYFYNGGIVWCKHLSAVQRLFGEQNDIVDGGELITMESDASSTELASPLSTHSPGAPTGPAWENGQQDNAWWSSLSPKLLLLATLSPMDPIALDNDTKVEFAHLLDRVITATLPTKPKLPRNIPLPPNVKSASETMPILPIAKKKALKGRHGPYSMGEASGRKAKEKVVRTAVKPVQVENALSVPNPKLAGYALLAARFDILIFTSDSGKTGLYTTTRPRIRWDSILEFLQSICTCKTSSISISNLFVIPSPYTHIFLH